MTEDPRYINMTRREFQTVKFHTTASNTLFNLALMKKSTWTQHINKKKHSLHVH